MRRLWSPRPAGFVAAFAAIFAAMAVGILVFNVIVDPYWAYGAPEIEGFNAVKPQVTNELRLAKANIVCRVKPDAVILGSSRAELGLDPEHPALSAAFQRPYNLSMAGMGIEEMLRMLQHAWYASDGKLRLAILALDDLMFAANREKIVFGGEIFGYDERRLIASPERNCRSTFLNDIEVLLLAKGLRSSIATLQHQDASELYLGNGMRNRERNMLATGMPRVGHAPAFTNNEFYYINKIWTAGAEQRFCFEAPEYGSTFQRLREMLRFAREHGIQIKILLSPVHARMLIAIREAGLWPMIEQYKRGLVEVLAEDAARYPDQPRFELWDFYTFNSISTEPVPVEGDKTTRMKWYWEISHYTHAAGAMALDRVMGHATAGRPVPADFGVLLNTGNIDAQIDKLLVDSREFDRRFPAVVTAIHATADRALAGRTGSMCTPSYMAFQQGTAALDQNDKSGAVRAFQQALSLADAEAAEARRRGLPDREVGLRSEVEAAIKTGAVERRLATWQAYQERAMKRRGERDFAGAARDFTEAINRGPPNTALFYLRGVTRADMDDHAGALVDFDAILKLDPSNATVPGLRERSLIALEAAELKRRGLPYDWQTYQERGIARRAQGDLAGASADFGVAIKLQPRNTALYYLRGVTLAELAVHSAAIEDFDAVLKLDPVNATVPGLRATSVTALQLETLKRQGLPYDWQSYQERGIARRAAGDLAGAVGDFGEAIKRGPRNPALFYLRGISLADLGQHAAALVDFDAVLALDPRNPTATELRKNALAAIDLDKLKRGAQPYDWITYQERGNTRRAQGDLAGAIADFSEAIKRGPPNTALYYLRAVSRSAAGDYAGAIADFDAVLKLDPGNVTVPGLRENSVAAQRAARAGAAADSVERPRQIR
jgi:tetratricopeptide (TPR) repeat protein